MSRLKNLTGLRFGRLVVLEMAENINKRTMWLCKCDCGNKKTIAGIDLTRGMVKSCGCYRHDFRTKDLTGQKFGRLLVIERDSINAGHGSTWKCICDCGKETIVRQDSLTTGHTTSFGCYRNSGESRVRHGMTGTRLHRIWMGIKNRCKNQSFRQWKDYGGRGISVCEDWNSKHGFDRFCEWALSNGYADDLEIDRIDNNGNYEPSNCRWVTHKENMNNRRAKVV